MDGGVPGAKGANFLPPIPHPARAYVASGKAALLGAFSQSLQRRKGAISLFVPPELDWEFLYCIACESSHSSKVDRRQRGASPIRIGGGNRPAFT